MHHQVAFAGCYLDLMSADIATNKIFVGAQIDQGSERVFLEFITKRLIEQQVPFIILANVHLEGRQIDCIVATEQTVSVVEVKSSYLPVRGDLNGKWSQLQASGVWRDYTNAYQQALSGKNALRDAMRTVKPVNGFYPDGYVVFTSGLPSGSEVTSGDFKISVTALDQFLSKFKLHGNSEWSINDWEVFAAKFKMMPVSLAEVLGSPEDRKQQDIIYHYCSSLVTEYEKDANCWLRENSDQPSKLLATATSGVGCIITGPSGCGKSLLARWIAVQMAKEGNPTFFFAAKNFNGSWAEFIRREVALISDQSPSELLRAISLVNKPVFLILDGANELGARRHDALRGIRALARRIGAILIITSQDRELPEFEGLCTLAVNRPSLNLKQRIAQSCCTNLNQTALEILEAIDSGIEAAIVGQIGNNLRADTTRLMLLDQYIRTRLARYARIAFFGLRRFASTLHEQVAFSMPEATFDEFMMAQGVHFEAIEELFAANLVTRRAGRISFSHEMIQNACTAFDLAREAMSDAATFGRRLSTPVLKPIAGDVISAIEDLPTCRTLLSEVSDPDLLAAAADDEFGTLPGSIARALLVDIKNACEFEILHSSLVLKNDNDMGQLEWTKDCRRDWTEAERGRLCAIALRATSGSEPDVYLELCLRMDEKLANEQRRLAEDARKLKFPLRSRSFELAYYGFGDQIGFTQITRACQPSFRKTIKGPKNRDFEFATLSSGQWHFLLGNGQQLFNENQFTEGLIYLFRERFRSEPYHVQLAALHAVGFARSSSEESLVRLVAAINALEVNPSNWAINSCIIDALKACGALEDDGDENRAQIKRELVSVLCKDDTQVDRDLALSICLRMFDHPFDSIYWDEVSSLHDEHRHLLYKRALGAPEVKNCMSLDWLIKEVASFEDATDAPILQPFTTLPDPSHCFPQDVWGGFVLATRFLGRHGVELVDVTGETLPEHCLLDIRMLVYASESKRKADIAAAEDAWKRLHNRPAQLVIGVLGEVNDALSGRNMWGEGTPPYQAKNMAGLYPDDCLKVARRFMADGIEAHYYQGARVRRNLGSSFAFYTVGHYGNRSDLARLRELSNAHPFAQDALTAIKLLDMV